MITDELKPLLSGVVTNLPELWSKRGDSIIEYGRTTRNDFLTLVEDELINVDFLPDVLDTVQTLVSGYFLSAVTLLVDVPEINVKKVLDKVAVTRDPIENILGSGAAVYKYVGMESFRHGLPSPDVDDMVSLALEAKRNSVKYTPSGKKYHQTVHQTDHHHTHHHNDQNNSNNSMFVQAADHSTQSKTTNIYNEASSDPKDQASVGIGRDTTKTISEVSRLSTGKLLEVNFERNGNRATVPVMIRLAVTNTDSASMRAIVSTAAIKNTFGERWRRMRKGELSMVKDLLLCHDLIAESRRTRILDKSGFFEHMMRNQSKNFLSGLFSLSPSINNASAVLVITENTAKAASVELGGTLDKFAIREKIFKATAAMLVVVVDTRWETAKIYHRGISTYTEVTKRDLQRASGKAGGSQVTDIINAYQAGTTPAI